MRLTLKMFLEFCVFCSLEVNGLQIMAGIVMELKNYNYTYQPQVRDNGFYQTMGCIARKNALARGLKKEVTTASKNMRYQHHNAPVMTCSQCTEEGCRNKVQCEATLEINRIYKCLQKLWNTVYNRGKKKDRYVLTTNDTTEDNKYDIIGETFMKDIQQKKGCSHVYSCAFFQAASYFGLIPAEMISWSTISSKSSGGYKLLDSIASKPTKKSISVNIAKQTFNELHNEIQSLYGSCIIPKNLLENMLCEIKRERDNNGTSPKKDVYIKLNARPIQNFFRLRYFDSNKVLLEMVPSVPDSDFMKISKNEHKRHTKYEVTAWEFKKGKSQRNRGFISWKYDECDKEICSLPPLNAKLHNDQCIAKLYT